jgi:hypothetical protein
MEWSAGFSSDKEKTEESDEELCIQTTTRVVTGLPVRSTLIHTVQVEPANRSIFLGQIFRSCRRTFYFETHALTDKKNPTWWLITAPPDVNQNADEPFYLFSIQWILITHRIEKNEHSEQQSSFENISSTYNLLDPKAFNSLHTWWLLPWFCYYMPLSFGNP